MASYILAIDQGTTSSRAMIFDENARIITTAQQEFSQHFPDDGWVEHEPEDIWQSVKSTCLQALKQENISAAHIAAIGITNQRETTLVWDRQTGEPVYPAIVWQDRRTSEYCASLKEQNLQSLKEQNLQSLIAEKTGLLIDPYFSATKLRWILENVPTARQRAEKGELAFGTVDSFILWRLTDGKVHRTDATNASRTLLFNIHSQQWDQELLDLFDIPHSLLPEVMDCAADFGETQTVFDRAIPILGIAGDQQAALIGQACFQEGMIKSTYGTGCFMMLNTGSKALSSKNRLLTTVAYRLNGEVSYALEGSIFVAGAAIQWLRDGIHLINKASDSERLAEQTTVDHGVFLVPAFTGLGAPYWDPHARGAIFGLTRDTGIKEIVTAGLQSVCYQSKDLLEAMHADGVKPRAIRVDGGMVANDWTMQFLADILGVTVERPDIIETTALGAAYLAGLQAGIFASQDALADLWQSEQRFEPVMAQPERDQLYHDWQEAVSRVQSKR